MLFVYSAVVTFALILVVHKNFQDNEDVHAVEPNAQADVLENQKLAESNHSVPEVYVDENADDNLIEADWKVKGEESQPEIKQEVIEIAKGDNFIGIMQKIGLEYSEALEVAKSLKKAGYNVKLLQVGQKIQVLKTVDMPFGELISVDKLVFEPNVETKYVVIKNDNDEFVAEKELTEFELETQIAEGEINTYLGGAMSHAGVPQSIIGNFINIFAYTVDFSTEIKAGNRFKVIYDRKVAPNGKVIKNGDIQFAELDLGRNGKISLYRYKDTQGGVDYYNEDGTVLKRTLDKKPLEFRRARISSRFGWRRHPILKDRRFHSGVDYAAPKGTRIYASGDGVVTRAQYAGGYGNMVKIRHNSEYSTGYAHMSGFAKGIRPGVRVKQGQVIGYVGSTGRSTGPHLHFEVVRNGRKVDPLRVKAATGTNLARKDLKIFKTVVEKINAKADGITEVAAVDDVSQAHPTEISQTN